jgi:hypothetical protein
VARRSWKLALVVLVLSASTLAQSEATDRRRVVLAVEGPVACGGTEALGESIQRRSSRIQVEPSEAENRVEVTIASKDTFEATVVIDKEGESTRRELSGVDCGELMEAVALVIVVTLDPTGRWSPESSETTTETGGGDAASSVIEPSAGEKSPSTAPPISAPSGYQDDLTPPSLGSPIDASGLVPDGFGVFAGARVVSGPAPSLLLGPELGVDILWQSEGVFAPRVAVSASRAWAAPERTSNGDAGFTLDQLLASLCPLQLGQNRWDVRPCLDGSFGRMLASGSNTLSPRSTQRPFRSFGASARLSVRPVWLLELWASGGIALLLVRDRYVFQPEILHDVPAQAVMGAAGLGLSFR